MEALPLTCCVALGSYATSLGFTFSPPSSGAASRLLWRLLCLHWLPGVQDSRAGPITLLLL